MAPLLRVESLTVRYAPRRLGGAGGGVTALDAVSLSVALGTTLAVVGASGSGKSTLAHCLACLERPTSGSLRLEDRELSTLGEAELRGVRRQLQLVFQDSATALNPRLTAGEIVCEPFVVQKMLSRGERSSRARRLFERVGLPFSLAERAAGELSGGQKQRLAVARALALEPRLLILDEALSAVDASVRAQIANLLVELQRAAGFACVYITHDLAMAALVSDEIAVLESGRLVEQGAAEQVLRRPMHEATRALLEAVPRWDRQPGHEAER